MTKKTFFLLLFSIILFLIGSIGLNIQISSYSIYSEGYTVADVHWRITEPKNMIIFESIALLLISYILQYKTSLKKNIKGTILILFGFSILLNGLYLGFKTKIELEPELRELNFTEDKRVESEEADIQNQRETKKLLNYFEKPSKQSENNAIDSLTTEELETTTKHIYTSKQADENYQFLKYFIIFCFIVAGLYNLLVKEK